jgi:hypothetical protein
VPLVLRHNDPLELNLAEYCGSVTVLELEAAAAFFAARVSLLKHDTLHLVHASADFDGVEFGALDRLFERYARIFAPIDFQIVRRSAWVCQSEAAQPHIAYWVDGRDTRAALSSTLRRFGSLAEAGEWLLLSGAEIATLERGEGFADLARFEHPLTTARAATA